MIPFALLLLPTASHAQQAPGGVGRPNTAGRDFTRNRENENPRGRERDGGRVDMQSRWMVLSYVDVPTMSEVEEVDGIVTGYGNEALWEDAERASPANSSGGQVPQ